MKEPWLQVSNTAYVQGFIQALSDLHLPEVKAQS